MVQKCMSCHARAKKYALGSGQHDLVTGNLAGQLRRFFFDLAGRSMAMSMSMSMSMII
jgi:hypothetical protein